MVTTTNIKYKDRVFAKLFGEEEHKEKLLSLYNAVNGTEHTNIEDLKIYTLDDVIYMKMKNDVSCIFDNFLSFYEHQSTINRNMPTRGFLYAAHSYEKYIAAEDIDLFSPVLQKLPTPQYCVFYNGDREMPDQVEMKLSDAFIQPVKNGVFEWTAVMYNINIGHNHELMEKCQELKEYTQLIGKVKENLRSGMLRNEAVIAAVDWCIENGILKDFLIQNKAGVTDMILTEYDEERTMNSYREAGRAEGLEEGIEIGRAEERDKFETERVAFEHTKNILEHERDALAAELARYKAMADMDIGAEIRSG